MTFQPRNFAVALVAEVLNVDHAGVIEDPRRVPAIQSLLGLQAAVQNAPTPSTGNAT